MTGPNPHEWHRRWVILARVQGRWVFWRWIEVRTDYYRPHREERRLPRTGEAP